MYSFAEDGADGSDNKYFYIYEDLLFIRYEGTQVSKFEKIMVKAQSTTGHFQTEKISLHFTKIEQNSFDNVKFEYFPDTKEMERAYGVVVIGKFVLEKKNQ